MLGGLKQNLVHTRTESSIDQKPISVPVSLKHVSKELSLKEKKKKKRGTSFSHCFPWNLCLAPYSTFPFRSMSDSQIFWGMWVSKLTLHSSPVSRPQSLLLWNVFAFFHFLSFLLAPSSEAFVPLQWSFTVESELLSLPGEASIPLSPCQV